MGDREGESFISPSSQRSRIEETCKRFKLDLIDTEPEINVSGGRALSKRKGLLWGVEAIEAGEASVLIVGYFDRLVRDLKIQWEVVSRVEAAGGEVLAVDFGRISEETAAQWLSATMVGAVHEYVRRQGREKTAEAQADAVARGIPPFAHIPPGYRRHVIGEDRKGRPVKGPFVVEPDEAALMLQAFRMRAERKSFNEIRGFLRDHGITRVHNAIAHLMENRVYLGELHFGKLVNLQAHEAIVPRDLFNRVQRVVGSPGRKAKSDRLLARLGVLRCHEGARMVASVKIRGKKRYPYYRCPPYGDCERPMTIAAELVEEGVVEAVRKELADVEGRASIEANARRAEQELEQAQDNLDSAIRTLSGFSAEEAATERLAELRERRDQAQEGVDQLGGTGGATRLPVGADWERLKLEGKRDFIRAIVERVTIAPGRGPDRISVKLFV